MSMALSFPFLIQLLGDDSYGGELFLSPLPLSYGRATVLFVKRPEALPTGSTGCGIELSIPPVDLWATT